MYIKIVSWNVNSLRSNIEKGFVAWLEATKPDIVCLQEVRATLDILQPLENLFPNYRCQWNPAIKPGYAGTAILSRFEPIKTEHGFINEPDTEGRVITADFGHFRVCSLYAPNAPATKEKLDNKSRWLESLNRHIWARTDKPLLICGDLNVAAGKLDSRGVKYPRGINGCSDMERDGLGKIFTDCNLIDPIRDLNPKKIISTWWHIGNPDRRNNNGIRFDYILLPKKHGNLVITSQIYDDVFGSDHCPVSMTIEITTDNLKPIDQLGQRALL